MNSCSIIVPSRNGTDTLRPVLEALSQIEKPDCELEVVLVDNASQDATAKLIASYAARLDATCISEPRPGKSYALNSAIEASRGDLIIFLDDDAIPEREWLMAYIDAARQQPKTNVFAGAVRPHWIKPPPAWLERLTASGRASGCTSHQVAAGAFRPEHLKGANFAVKRAAIGALRFDTQTMNFGRARLAVGGEDSQFTRSLLRKGETISFVPDAIVSHIILPHEMTLHFQLKRFARIGRSAAAINSGSEKATMTAALKVPFFAAISLLRLTIGDRTGAAGAIMQAAMNLGILDYVARKRVL